MLLSLFLFVYGILGSIGNSTSYKFEVDDPTVETAIHRLDNDEQKKELAKLEQRKKELDRSTFIYGGLIVFGIASIVYLITKRKRILTK